MFSFCTQHLEGPDEDWYLASASSGFWIRRSLVGTEAQIFGLVKKVLQRFEPDVLVKQ
jgi:hypothetical protein